MTQDGIDSRTVALHRAIEVAGGVARLAKGLGITIQAVAQWKIVPDRRARAVETLTGVSRYELRPDIFGDPPIRSLGVGEARVA